MVHNGNFRSSKMKQRNKVDGKGKGRLVPFKTPIADDVNFPHTAPHLIRVLNSAHAHTQPSNSVSGGMCAKGTFWQMTFLAFTVG